MPDPSAEHKFVILSTEIGQSPPPRIRGFDGLRGLAASAVVVHHALIYHTSLGGLGVLLFFVLSGYLITGILHRSRMQVENGRHSVQDAFSTFWWRRILRICPPYYVALVIVTIVQLVALGQDSLLREFAWYALYLQNIYIGLISNTWDSFTHTWTLAIEQQFYLLFSPLLLLLPSRRHITAIVVVIVIAYAGWSGLLIGNAHKYAAAVLPMYGILFLATGGILALCGRRVPDFFAGHGALALAALVLVWDVGRGRFEKIIPFFPSEQLRTIILLLAMAIIVLYVIRKQDGWIVRFLEWPALRFIGKISYALYIVHYPIAIVCGGPYNALVVSFGADPNGLASRLAYFALVYGASVGLATLSWYGLERRALGLKLTPWFGFRFGSLSRSRY